MNQTLKSDEELIALLEHTMRRVAQAAPTMRFDDAHHDNRWMATAAAAVLVVAGATRAAIVVSSRHDSAPVDTSAVASEPTSQGSSPTSPTPDTVDPSAIGSPTVTVIGVTDDFPSVVPRPDTFDTMRIMNWDNLAVGWEFNAQGEPTNSVERCTSYVSSFGDSWTSTAKTDEAPSVLYARLLDDTEWQVGVYCTEDGAYLVQVMRSPNYVEPTVGTLAQNESAESDPSPTTDTVQPGLPAGASNIAPETIPDVFPALVPKPDTFGSMTKMMFDDVAVGWEFLEQGEATSSVERCTQYGASFDDSWTSTAKTDEAPSVLYARLFDNNEWRVGVYCTEDGAYLVQVMASPNGAGTPGG